VRALRRARRCELRAAELRSTCARR
jgi:hypothetical protein